MSVDYCSYHQNCLYNKPVSYNKKLPINFYFIIQVILTSVLLIVLSRIML